MQNVSFQPRPLAGCQNVNLAPVVLVVGDAFKYLGAGDVWEAATDNAVHRLTILEETLDIVAKVLLSHTDHF